MRTFSKIRSRRWMLAATGALTLSLLGCARPLKDQLAGRWRQTNGQWELTFMKDGTVASALGPFELAGTWSTPDEKNVRITPKGLAGAVMGDSLCPVTLAGERMQITIRGVAQEFQRVAER